MACAVSVVLAQLSYLLYTTWKFSTHSWLLHCNCNYNPVIQPPKWSQAGSSEHRNMTYQDRPSGLKGPLMDLNLGPNMEL